MFRPHARRWNQWCHHFVIELFSLVKEFKLWHPWYINSVNSFHQLLQIVFSLLAYSWKSKQIILKYSLWSKESRFAKKSHPMQEEEPMNSPFVWGGSKWFIQIFRDLDLVESTEKVKSKDFFYFISLNIYFHDIKKHVEHSDWCNDKSQPHFP